MSRPRDSACRVGVPQVTEMFEERYGNCSESRFLGLQQANAARHQLSINFGKSIPGVTENSPYGRRVAPLDCALTRQALQPCDRFFSPGLRPVRLSSQDAVVLDPSHELECATPQSLWLSRVAHSAWRYRGWTCPQGSSGLQP
jgi:hypothetical protein